MLHHQTPVTSIKDCSPKPPIPVPPPQVSPQWPYLLPFAYFPLNIFILLLIILDAEEWFVFWFLLLLLFSFPPKKLTS